MPVSNHVTGISELSSPYREDPAKILNFQGSSSWQLNENDLFPSSNMAFDQSRHRNKVRFVEQHTAIVIKANEDSE